MPQELVVTEFDRVDDDGGPEVYAVKDGVLFIIPRSIVYEVVTGEGGTVELAKWKAIELQLV